MKHNRLKNMRMYLSGPIDADREAGHQWRIDIGNWLSKRGALYIDPYRKNLKYFNGEINDDKVCEEIEKAKAEKNYNKIAELARKIRVIDLRACDISDALIVNLDLSIRTMGTMEEIFLANRQLKPILIMCPQGKINVPTWCHGTLPHSLFFESWDELKEYLRHIDEDEEFDDLGRWRFFDFEE